MSEIKKGVRPVRGLSEEHAKRVAESDALRAANRNNVLGVMPKPEVERPTPKQAEEEEDDAC